MRYIGNKLNLLNFIYSIAEEHHIPKGIFCDIFSGTANVAKYFKLKGFQIISNDFMFYSYVFQRAYIAINSLPKFSGLRNVVSNTDIFSVFSFLNNLKGKKGFIYKNYCEEGSKGATHKRNYFSAYNAPKIDAIRDKLDDWKTDKLINEDEFYVLLCALLEAIPSVSNISGTYGAFLKINDPRMFKPLLLEVPSLVESNLKHRCYQKDANELIKEITCDILYIDPPYNSRQYAPNYHILESIAVWDKKIIDNKTGLRPYDHQKSDYCYEKKCIAAFDHLISNAHSKHILFSYNTEGIIPRQEIMKILSKRGRVILHTQDYRRFKSHSRGEENSSGLQELLFYTKIV